MGERMSSRDKILQWIGEHLDELKAVNESEKAGDMIASMKDVDVPFRVGIGNALQEKDF